jgi:hypothetical protein
MVEEDVPEPKKRPKAKKPKPSPKKAGKPAVAKAAGKAKKGAKKDPNKPKQGLSAYMFYVKANRQRIIDENEGISFGEVGKKCGAEWSK